MKSHIAHYPLIGIVIFLAMLTWTVQGSSTAPHTTRGPLQWSGDGSKLAFVEGSTVTILDAVSGAVISDFTAAAPINAVSWSPDNQFLAIGTNNGEVIIWDIAQEDPMKILTLEYPRVLSLIWYPDGSRLLAYAATDDLEYITQYLWHTPEFRLVSQQQGGMYFALAFDPTEQLLAQTAVRVIRIRDAASLETFKRIELNGDMENMVNSVAWSHDSAKLLTGSEAGNLQLWDVTESQEKLINTIDLNLTADSQIRALSFSADGRNLMAVDAEGYSARFEVSTGMRIAEATFPVNAAAVWSPYGARLAVQIASQTSANGLRTVSGDTFRIEVPFASIDQLNAIADLLTNDKILLFADQFEELFTLTHEADRERFVNLLKHDAAQVRVLATMRADFYENAAPHFEKQLRQNFTLSQPSPFALYEMVTQPAGLAGLTFDAGLPEQIVTDLGDEPGALALMAYLLEQLYLREQARGDGVLRQSDYDDLGGVQKATGTHAEYIYQQLPADDDEKDTWMQRVFYELVSVDERGTATRQRSALGKFDDEALALIRAFVEARLLVTDKDEVEVAHEALFRSWERLRDWIASAQEELILLRQVRTAAHDWQTRQRPDYLLWPQERLVLVYAMLERLKPKLNEVERDFIEPEQNRLLRELEALPHDSSNHDRRRDIGDRLAVIGDTRSGVGVIDGIPDILWLPVTSTGEINMEGRMFSTQPLLVSKFLITNRQFQSFIDAKDGYGDER